MNKSYNFIKRFIYKPKNIKLLPHSINKSIA